MHLLKNVRNYNNSLDVTYRYYLNFTYTAARRAAVKVHIHKCSEENKLSHFVIISPYAESCARGECLLYAHTQRAADNGNIQKKI